MKIIQSLFVLMIMLVGGVGLMINLPAAMAQDGINASFIVSHNDSRPQGIRVFSVEELDNYVYEYHKGNYPMALDKNKYNESFFEDRFLYLSLVRITGSSPKLEIASVSETADSIDVEIRVPALPATPDMAYWILLLEMDRTDELIDKDVIVTVIPPQLVHINVIAGTGGTATGGGMYYITTSVSLIATANEGYTFCGWYEDNVLVSDNPTYCITVTVDRALEARFEPDLVVNTDASGQAAISAYSLAGANSLTVSGDVSVTFNKEALAVFDHTKAVVISVKNADKNVLNTKVKSLVGNRPAHDISATQNGEYVNDFRDGQINISIPYTLDKGENQNCVLAYSVGSDGEPIMMKSRYKDGIVAFTTNQLSTFAVGYNKITFNDVPDESWFADAINFISARGIASGVGDNMFSPLEGSTRAQLVKLVCETYGIESVNNDDNFDDAYGSDGESVWYTNYLAAAKQAKIIEGVGENKFNPNGPLTRQEMFTMLYRTLKELKMLPIGEGNDINTFADYKSVADWAEEAITYLTANGIVKGSDNKLDPLKPASRAEMSQVLYNILVLS